MYIQLSVTSRRTKYLLRKLEIILYGMVYFFLSKDRKMPKPIPNPDLIIQNKNSNVTTKQIIFIRHGESDWNLIFNKSKLLLIPRFILAVGREILKFPTGDSAFYDSPLNLEGMYIYPNQTSLYPSLSLLYIYIALFLSS